MGEKLIKTETYLAGSLIGHLLNLSGSETISDIVTNPNGTITIHMKRGDLEGSLTVNPDQLTIE
jgi:hypothetical protein